MTDHMSTEKDQMISTLQAYYVHSNEGQFIKEIVEILTQGRFWVRDFQKLINAHKYGYQPDDLPDRHRLSRNVFWKLLRSKLKDPVPWVNRYDPIWVAYMFGDAQLMWLLLKHNFGCAWRMEDIPKLRPLRPIIERYLNLNTPYEIRICLNKLGDYSCQSQRRLKAVVWGLNTMSYRKDPTFRRYKVMCLKILFEFIPEPYITSAEIGGVVRHIIGNQKGADVFVSKVCQKFEAFYPESNKPYQPRPLKHLSRCCILQKLRRVGRLPQGVDQLRLSEDLSNYILPKKCPFLPDNTLTADENVSGKDSLPEESSPSSLSEDEALVEEELHSDVDSEEEEALVEDSSSTRSYSFHSSDVDSEDEFYSAVESLLDEDSLFSEIHTNYSERLILNLRNRKFAILKQSKL